MSLYGPPTRVHSPPMRHNHQRLHTTMRATSACASAYESASMRARATSGRLHDSAGTRARENMYGPTHIIHPHAHPTPMSARLDRHFSTAHLGVYASAHPTA